jgi:DNA-binding SARP family transcriptional activator
MEPSPLTISLFGPLRVTARGEPLPRVRTRSVEWLLALLALRHGRAVSRAWLAGTLWPESGESRSLQNLRDELMRLRQALGPEGARLQSPARDLLTLDLAGAEVDVVRFDAGIQAGDEASLHEAGGRRAGRVPARKALAASRRKAGGRRAEAERPPCSVEASGED